MLRAKKKSKNRPQPHVADSHHENMLSLFRHAVETDEDRAVKINYKDITVKHEGLVCTVSGKYSTSADGDTWQEHTLQITYEADSPEAIFENDDAFAPLILSLFTESATACIFFPSVDDIFAFLWSLIIFNAPDEFGVKPRILFRPFKDSLRELITPIADLASAVIFIDRESIDTSDI